MQQRKSRRDEICLFLPQAVDLLEIPSAGREISRKINIQGKLKEIKKQADQLRKNILKWAWEDSNIPGDSGFLSYINQCFCHLREQFSGFANSLCKSVPRFYCRQRILECFSEHSV